MRLHSVRFMLLIGLLMAALMGCATAEPTTVEVTRLVNNDVPVTVEVTRIVPQEVQIIVEVTRVVEVEVEVVVTATPEAETVAEAAAPTETPTPEPTATAVSQATPVSGNTYTVRVGDTLSTISQQTGVSVEAIMTANNLSNANVIAVGQELLIPGWTGETAVAPPPPPAGQPTSPTGPTAPVGANLLPNPSFEEGWYFFNGVSEWQLPNGWLMSVDEGPNNLTPGSGGRFFRPEIRVLARADIPPAEQNLFLFDGQHTIKAFKGDAPTNFAIFTDVALQPGTYRFAANFFADSVTGYSGNQKIFNGDSLSAEYRIIHNNGGTGWTSAPGGNKSSPVYEFTMTEPGTVRLGVAFRNRYAQSNNGWFIDDWSLFAIGQ
jgi:LysM repeat protein